MRPDEIVRDLRRLAENSRSKRDVLIAAADRIEELLSESEDHIGQIESEQEEIRKLDRQLVASRRREQAAIHDIMCRDHCDVCKYSKNDGSCDESDFDCETCKNTCPCATCRNESNWQWRGPQEAGKGAGE